MSYIADLERKYIEALERIKALEVDVVRLTDQNEKLSHIPPVPLAFGLTRRETEVLKVLMSRGLSTKEQILDAAWADKYAFDDEPQIKIVDVFICKLRSKLKPFGIEIKTLWGNGYTMETAMKEKIRQINKEAASRAA